MKYVFLVFGVCFVTLLATDDVDLYKKLQKEVSKKESIVHTGGDSSVVVKSKDTNLTKKIKNLLKKEKVVQTTKKFEKILKD